MRNEPPLTLTDSVVMVGWGGGGGVEMLQLVLCRCYLGKILDAYVITGLFEEVAHRLGQVLVQADVTLRIRMRATVMPLAAQGSTQQ